MTEIAKQEGRNESQREDGMLTPSFSKMEHQ